MRHITRQMVAPVINSLRDTFDAHLLEKRVLWLQPEASLENC